MDVQTLILRKQAVLKKILLHHLIKHVLLCMYAKKIDKYQLRSLQELKICYCLINGKNRQKKRSPDTTYRFFCRGICWESLSNSVRTITKLWNPQIWSCYVLARLCSEGTCRGTSGSIFGHDFRQGSKVNAGSAIIRGNYGLNNSNYLE